MTNQEAFDKALAHLRKQGRAAVGDDGMPRYRAPDGSKCAVGCLITDEEYGPAMDGDGLNLFGEVPSLKSLDAYLLGDMQAAHDDELKDRGLNCWDEKMSRIAMRHGLTYTPPQATP